MTSRFRPSTSAPTALPSSCMMRAGSFILGDPRRTNTAAEKSEPRLRLLGSLIRILLGMGAATYSFSIPIPDEARELERGLRQRDPDLFDRLIEQYHYRLFRYLLYLTGNRETAEDLFQETWVRVLERGHQYDGKRKFEAWLFTIARHLAIDWMRQRKALGFPVGLEDLSDRANIRAASESSTHDTTSPVALATSREEGERIAGALAHLPAAYREVLVLRFQEDLGLEEIARLIGAPLSTVKSRVYRGLNALRELLEEPKS